MVSIRTIFLLLQLQGNPCVINIINLRLETEDNSINDTNGVGKQYD